MLLACCVQLRNVGLTWKNIYIYICGMLVFLCPFPSGLQSPPANHSPLLPAGRHPEAPPVTSGQSSNKPLHKLEENTKKAETHPPKNTHKNMTNSNLTSLKESVAELEDFKQSHYQRKLCHCYCY